MIYILRIWSK